VAIESLEAPPVDPTLEWIWRAWHRLSDDRPRFGGGMGPPVPGRIPWLTVRLWCRHHDLTKGEMDMLDVCFAAMDAVYIDWWSAAQKEANEP
jgi:hypothetical protein